MNFSLQKQFLFAILIFLCFPFFPSSAFAFPQMKQSTKIIEEQLVVATPVKRLPISAKDLKKYLSGQKPTWPDESPVTIVLFPKKSNELIWLCKNVIKIPPSTYRRFLMQKAFRSGINIVEVETQEEAVAVFKENPGAISAIGDSHLSEDIHPIVIQ
jgi:hypothetical protein